MIAAGRSYLRAVGPCYGAFGLGMALYFASQGAGRMAWPLVAAVLRTVIAVGGGWLALRLGGGLHGLFVALGVALVAMCAVNAASVAGGVWFRG